MTERRDLSAWIAGWAAQAPERVAIREADRVIDYRALDAMIGRFAALLAARGVGAGDRVAHLGHNRPEVLALVFACARLGATLVPLNGRLAPPEHAFVLEHAGARVVVADAASEAHLGETGVRGLEVLSTNDPTDAARDPPPPAGGPDAPILIVYTSGTTGRPKGAVLTQSALFWNAVNSAHAHDLVSTDRVLTNLPLFHVGGLNIQTLPALHAGAEVILHAQFDPGRALADIAGHRPTVYLMVPATMTALIRHPDWDATDLGSLRVAMAGSSTIPVPLIEAFHARGVPVGQIYGSTETAPIATVLRAADAMAHPGSAGRRAVHCEVRVVDADDRPLPPGERGEICVRGPNVMREYWRDPQATAEAMRGGWFHSGDVGHIDADGFLTVDDRLKDVVISGGENVYPAELENVLAECDALAEYAVIGCSDPEWGEVPVACVVRKPDHDIDAAGVLALFDGRLARFKHPRAVRFEDALPRTAMGKVQKFRLRERIAGEG